MKHDLHDLIRFLHFGWGSMRVPFSTSLVVQWNWDFIGDRFVFLENCRTVGSRVATSRLTTTLCVEAAEKLGTKMVWARQGTPWKITILNPQSWRSQLGDFEVPSVSPTWPSVGNTPPNFMIHFGVLKELIEEFMHPSYVTTFSRSKVCLKPAEAMADILGSLEDGTTPCDGCAEKDGRLLPPFFFWWWGMSVKVCYPKLAILFPETWARYRVFFFSSVFFNFYPQNPCGRWIFHDFPKTDTWHIFPLAQLPENLEPIWMKLWRVQSSGWRNLSTSEQK